MNTGIGNRKLVEAEVLRVLDEVLSLGGRGLVFDSRTRLLGALPELDSMAVVSVIAALEERFDIALDDGEIDSTTFETVGALVEFVAQRVPGE
jgi:acyl carrier protein